MSLSMTTPNKFHPSPLDLLGVRRKVDSDLVNWARFSWILRRLGCSLTGESESLILGEEKCLFILCEFMLKLPAVYVPILELTGSLPDLQYSHMMAAPQGWRI